LENQSPDRPQPTEKPTLQSILLDHPQKYYNVHEIGKNNHQLMRNQLDDTVFADFVDIVVFLRVIEED
jgi:hypothetical protein